MIAASQLAWPGVDRDRALEAYWALHDAAVMLRLNAAHRQSTGRSAMASLRFARDKLVAARGYLGAVGYEKGGRLLWD